MARIGACENSRFRGRSMSQHNRSSGSPVLQPRFRAGFCFMGVSLAASRKWSRARSGFRAPRERCSICRCPQVCGPVIREKHCLIATRRAVAVAVSGRKLFFWPTCSKGTRAPSNARTEGDLFCDSGRRRIGPPQRLNRRAGTCSGLLGQSRCSLSRRAHLPDDGSAAP